MPARQRGSCLHAGTCCSCRLHAGMQASKPAQLRVLAKLVFGLACPVHANMSACLCFTATLCKRTPSESCMHAHACVHLPDVGTGATSACWPAAAPPAAPVAVAVARISTSSAPDASSCASQGVSVAGALAASVRSAGRLMNTASLVTCTRTMQAGRQAGGGGLSAGTGLDRIGGSILCTVEAVQCSGQSGARDT